MIDILDLVESEGLKAKLRVAAPDEWIDAAKALNYLPVMYSAPMIDYQIEYWRGNGWSVEDLSLIFCRDGKSLGIWPLTLSSHRESGKRVLGLAGGNLLPPLFHRSVARRTLKSMAASCLNIATECSRQFETAGWASEEGFMNGDGGISDWHQKALQSGASVVLGHDLFTDVTPSMADIKSGLRKSYKSLLSSGSRLWKVQVMTQANAALWDEFRSLHISVAGRVTRSLESWQLQQEAIGSGDAFFVYLTGADGRMVGGGLFYMTKDEASYVVGAYDRSLFDKPLGHVVQYRAIEEMKKHGVSWYRLGARSYPSDSPAPSLKELSIAEFKQGFSSHVFPRYWVGYGQT